MAPNTAAAKKSPATPAATVTSAATVPAAKHPAAESPKTGITPMGIPLLVATPVDLGRILRELEGLDEQLLQEHLRGNDSPERPRTSKLMDQILEVNKVDLLDAKHRKDLMELLNVVKKKSPVLHMSFSADPPASFIEKLMTWLRREIHPTVLITIGLQPNIGAGCVIRTTNRNFDLSLRQNFANKRDLLKEAIMEKMVPEAKAEQPHGISTESASGPEYEFRPPQQTQQPQTQQQPQPEAQA